MCSTVLFSLTSEIVNVDVLMSHVILLYIPFKMTFVKIDAKWAKCVQFEVLVE
jgi:hypothetical protein